VKLLERQDRLLSRSCHEPSFALELEPEPDLEINLKLGLDRSELIREAVDIAARLHAIGYGHLSLFDRYLVEEVTES